MRNFGKDFDKYAARMERNIDQMTIDTLTKERAQRTGRKKNELGKMDKRE
jgi:hypothetical protein